jgi:hypothetical protein
VSSSKDKRNKEWTIVILVVLVLHLALFLYVRPSFFSIFKKSITSPSQGNQGEPFSPAAILTIPIEIEDEPLLEQDPVQDALEPAPEEQQRPKETTRMLTSEVVQTDEGRSTDAPVDVESLVGEDLETLPQNMGPAGITIPPRALEITWPDTRNLKHCLGHHIDIKIQVDETGSIVSATPINADQTSDCVQAALSSAKRIVFRPGRVDGVPTTMWTQVRIEFRKKR